MIDAALAAPHPRQILLECVDQTRASERQGASRREAVRLALSLRMRPIFSTTLTTIFGIAQQYLIVGWGSMFPIFGWTPGFAKDHRPRVPVEAPSLRTAPDLIIHTARALTMDARAPFVD